METGELVALLGPSGSGKTTLLRVIAGLEQADAGSVYFHGSDATNLPVGERRVGFVFQNYALFRHMTVANNITFGLRMRPRRERPSREEIAAKLKELLKLVQLEALGGRYPSQLSGGQRQRVALARALAIDPSVLLLDEPFGALDAQVRKDLRRWVRRLHEELHITTVFVTHDQEEALEIADRVVVMNHSRIEQIGTPQEVYDEPATPFALKFLGNVNAVRGDDLRSAGDGEVSFVRPHDVEIMNERNGAPVREAVLKHVNAAGAIARLELRLRETDEVIEVELPRARFAELALKVGDDAYVRFSKVRTFASHALTTDGAKSSGR